MVMIPDLPMPAEWAGHPYSGPPARWHVRTEFGEFEILTTGVKWYDTRAKVGGDAFLSRINSSLLLTRVESSPNCID
jgi:hypothetical protein